MGSEVDDFADELQQQILKELREVYSEKVIELFLQPKNIGKIEKPDGFGRIKGPCGDTMEIFIKVNNGIIQAATYRTDGCGPSIASGSMATELIKGKTIEEAGSITDKDVLHALGGLPDDSKHCALLAANTIKAAVNDYRKTNKEPWKRKYRNL
jgi:nitrogen fixation NifU-like protein